MRMPCQVEGVGLGLRRTFIDEVINTPDLPIDFLEIAPENWVKMGGANGKKLRQLTERFPFVCHGLSLDLGGIRPLDFDYLAQLKTFFKQHQIRCYTEHLSYCGDSGHLYDLLPIPFTEEAVSYVADRIHQVQDFLEQPIGIENVSFYAMPSDEMSEIEFVKVILAEANCGYLLDVNNVYVNAINHDQYSPEEFIAQMPTERIMYLHMAGHFDEAEDLKIDTHGEPVKEAVWQLLDFTYQQHGMQPTLLERDFNIPPLSELMAEMARIRQIQTPYVENKDD
ncbi:HvfB family MNIO-type RiPP peptide maturase [Galenea microaerophila]